MRIRRKNQQASRTFLVAAVALLALIILIATVYLLFDGRYKTIPGSRIDNSASAVIINYSNDHASDQQSRWLAYSLEQAGLPVFEVELETEADTTDFSTIISKWHNWKQERELDQGRVWLLFSGVEPDIAVELSLAWEDSDLVLLAGFGELKYFTSWQDFASSLSLRWPEDRSILVYHTASDKAEAAALYERISNEDAWLFPGQRQYSGSSVSMIRSSDGGAKIGLLQTGLLDQYSWSASYIESITSELINEASSDESPVRIADRIIQASDRLRVQWYLLPIILILLILISLLSGFLVLAAVFDRTGKNSEEQSTDEKAESLPTLKVSVQPTEQPLEHEQTAGFNDKKMQFLRILLISSVFLSVFALLNAIRLLPLLTTSWWITALALVILMIFLIPDARLGIAEQKLEKKSVLRVLSGLLWVFYLIVVVFLIFRALFVATVPSDSIVWFLTGILLPVAARIIVRRLSAIGSRIWLTLPIGAWFILNGISILIHFSGFN